MKEKISRENFRAGIVLNLIHDMIVMASKLSDRMVSLVNTFHTL